MDLIKEGPILLLGEGDFSFSVAFHPKVSNIELVSTSFLSEKDVREVHKGADKNISHLKAKGVTIHHSVDATNLSSSVIKDRKFRRIIFNFPHVGGKSNIKKNRQLLKDFFPSAKTVLAEDKDDLISDICVTLAKGQGGTPEDTSPRLWHDSWQVVAAATYSDLVLSDIWPFSAEAFTEYSCTGFKGEDRQFHNEGALTYVFRRSNPVTEPLSKALNVSRVKCEMNERNVVLHQHLASKVRRKILSECHHPINLTKKHFQEVLSTHLCTEFIDVSDNFTPFVSTNQPIVYNDTAYLVSNGKESVYLRSSLLDSVCMISEAFVKHECVYHATGEIYRRPGMNSQDQPVQHEQCILMKGFLNNITECINKTLEEVLKDTKVHIQHCENIDYLNNHAYDISSITLSYDSMNKYYEVSCNQVEAKGPPELKMNIPKTQKCEYVIGYIGRLNLNILSDSSDQENIKRMRKNEEESICFCVINLDKLSMIRYDISDQRLIWSQNSSFLEQFHNRQINETFSYKQISLFPPLWRHDISFWEKGDGEFNENLFYDIVLDVTKELVKVIFLANKWEEPNTGRISRCYRIIYQSNDYAISHSCAHTFQNAVRLTVAKEMGVELR